MAQEEIEFLKERSKEFYEEALELFKKGKYNLSAFTLEQSLQLYLKYLIGKKVGDWPKTHYLDELVNSLAEAYNKEEFIEYKKENSLFFDDLSDAYFTSRYFPKKFNKELVEELLKNFEKFIKFIEEILNEKFNSN
jgi:HEPN domain-containing protein